MFRPEAARQKALRSAVRGDGGPARRRRLETRRPGGGGPQTDERLGPPPPAGSPSLGKPTGSANPRPSSIL